MADLDKFLSKKGYCKIALKQIKSNHFQIQAIINGVKGTFIVDTGASSTCIGISQVKKFKLQPEKSDIKATGAGTTEIQTQVSKKNSIKIKKWKNKKAKFILLDIDHINNALEKHQAKPIDGILGADILEKAKAVIDYQKKCLYLK